MQLRAGQTIATAIASVMISGATLAASARSGDQAMTVSITPPRAFAPAIVQALVRVARHSDNRVLRVTIDSGSFYRSSDLPLAGAEAPTAHWVRWPSVPAGSYVVIVELFRSDGTRQIIGGSRLEILGP